MHIIEIKNPKEAEDEIKKIKSDKIGISIMKHKALFRVLKIKSLPPLLTNIIKQEMLSIGGEAANTRGAINHSVTKSDLLIMGTLAQLKKLIQKLKKHYFGLKGIADEIEETLNNYSKKTKLKVGKKIWQFKNRTYLMGILNITPDSFSDGGKFTNVDKAVSHGLKLYEEGADIIDIGGESTRPGSKPISGKVEIRRILPVIKKLAKKIPVSIDTYKSVVAKAALDNGAVMVNDISGLHFDKKMAAVVAAFDAAVAIMHIQGSPQNMQKNPKYIDLISEISDYFKKGLEIANNAGILNDRIIIDPGFGFGKSVKDNLEILKRLRELKSLGYPILIGTSRKSTIGKILNLPIEDRMEGTAATAAVAIQNGANVLRVHDVLKIKRVAKMTDAIVGRS